MDNLTTNYYIIGDKWLFFKIYLGYKIADSVLLEFKPLFDEFLRKKYIEKWFFIRYHDPDFHIRLRFLLTDISFLGFIINRIKLYLKPLLDNLQIYKVIIDTYIPEIVRYGEKTIEHSESFFYYDSKTILHMINTIQVFNNVNLRWNFAIKSIDYFLNDFEFSINRKLQILEILNNSFKKEFNVDKNKVLRKQLNGKFRLERKNLQFILSPRSYNKEIYYHLFYPLEERSNNTKIILKEIRYILKNDKYIINDLCYSYIHMMMNRIFRSKPRLNEMVIYFLLFKYYKTEIARLNNIIS